MHPALPLAFSMGDTLADVREVLKHNGTTRGGMLNERFGEAVIVVFSLPKQLTRKLFQVPLSRFASFFLKLTTETEDAAFLLFPATISQEDTIGGNCGAIKSQVHANHLFTRIDDRSRQRDNNMQEVAPIALAQISRANFAANVLTGMFGNTQGYDLPPGHRGNADSQALPFDPVRTLVIADGSAYRLRTAHRLEPGWRFPTLFCLGYQLEIACCVLFLPSESGFHRFGGFDAGSADQLGRQIRILCAQRIVGLFMQLDAVATSGFKTGTGNRIKTCRMLCQRALQDTCLFWRGFEL